MSTRIIVGIEPGCDWPGLRRALAQAGAETIKDPTASLPDAAVAILAEHVDGAAFIAQVARLPGVRYAEPDAPVST